MPEPGEFNLIEGRRCNGRIFVYKRGTRPGGLVNGGRAGYVIFSIFCNRVYYFGHCMDEHRNRNAF